MFWVQIYRCLEESSHPHNQPTFVAKAAELTRRLLISAGLQDITSLFQGAEYAPFVGPKSVAVIVFKICLMIGSRAVLGNSASLTGTKGREQSNNRPTW
jgi:hypothetical protein